MNTYDTLTEAIADLRKRDYVLDYNLTGAGAQCQQLPEILGPEELDIQEVHRFEGDSNPDDNTVLYAVQSHKNAGNKGLLVAAYGADVDAQAADFIRRLQLPSTQ